MPQNGRLNVLDLTTGYPRLSLPGNVLHRRDYYRQPYVPAGTDEFAFEKWSGSNIESIQPIIAKLIVGGRDLTADEIEQFIMYLVLQRHKVPKQAESAKDVYQAELIETIESFAPKLGQELKNGARTITIKDHAFRFNYLRMVVEGGEYYNYISRMRWEILKAPTGYSFRVKIT